MRELGEEAMYAGDLILVNNWTAFHFPEDQEVQLLCVLDNKPRLRLRPWYRCIKNRTSLVVCRAGRRLCPGVSFTNRRHRQSIGFVS